LFVLNNHQTFISIWFKLRSLIKLYNIWLDRRPLNWVDIEGQSNPQVKPDHWSRWQH
jgi:hypothetical protein